MLLDHVTASCCGCTAVFCITLLASLLYVVRNGLSDCVMLIHPSFFGRAAYMGTKPTNTVEKTKQRHQKPTKLGK
jgi:hypothetical protein